jgi:hypothetical protein
MPPISKSDIHATGATASLLSFITWLLGRFVFHGSVPPEVTGAILLVLPLGISLVTGYAVRHRLMADARTAAHIMSLTEPATTPQRPPTAP